MPIKKRYEIIDSKQDVARHIAQIRGLFKKNPTLIDVLLFVYRNEPASVTEISRSLPFLSRRRMVDLVNQLHTLKLFDEIGVLDALKANPNNTTIKEVVIKWRKIEKKLPMKIALHVRKMMKYYSVNDFGESFVPIVCKMINKGFRERGA